VNARLIKCTIFCLFVILATGCSTRWSHFETRGDKCIDGPRIAVIPVINQCEQFKESWNLGREMTLAIRDELLQNGDVCVLKKDKVDYKLSQMPKWDLCHFEDLKRNIWPYFGRAEFVVLFDILEHQTKPYEKPKIVPFDYHEKISRGWILTMKIRLVILDVRNRCREAIIDQIVCCSHTIPAEGECCDYREDCWGTHSYAFSPFYLCHDRMAKNIAFIIASHCIEAKNNKAK
jgi:hypothetical protein